MNAGMDFGASRKVLIVDDVESVADYLRDVLLSLDHRPEVSINVEEALTKFQPGKYDLIVTDFNMPGMSGAEFARAIHRIHSQQAILLITGDAMRAEYNGPEMDHFTALLQKPFSLDEFQEKITGIFATGC